MSLSQENNRMTAINRIKVVLVEKQRTNKWLAEQLGKSENTISKWCLNKVQPSPDCILQIVNVLDVEIRSLIVASKSKESYD